MKEVLRIFLWRFFLLNIWLVLGGCAFDHSQKGLHESFIVGKNFIVGKKTISFYEKRGARTISVKALSNGNIENEYVTANSFVAEAARNSGVFHCHYFYEYEPQSGLIVKFRFDEKSQYACKTSGV